MLRRTHTYTRTYRWLDHHLHSGVVATAHTILDDASTQTHLPCTVVYGRCDLLHLPVHSRTLTSACDANLPATYDYRIRSRGVRIRTLSRLAVTTFYHSFPTPNGWTLGPTTRTLPLRMQTGR